VLTDHSLRELLAAFPPRSTVESNLGGVTDAAFVEAARRESHGSPRTHSPRADAADRPLAIRA
jgi:hypothetical protein